MTVETIQFEGKLMGYAKSRNKDGDWTDIRLQVHPEETEELNRLKLGQRLQCVVVPIDDDEKPLPVKPKGGDLAKAAGILCSNERFQGWLRKRAGEPPFLVHGEHRPSWAAEFMRNSLGIDSRAELDHNPEAAQKFLNLKAEFEQAHGMLTEKRG